MSERVPPGNVDVLNVAWADAFSVPLPSVVVPSRKVTVPVGVPGPPPVTVAVSVIVWPKVEGFNEEVRAVVLEKLLTVWVIAADVLAVKLLSPP